MNRQFSCHGFSTRRRRSHFAQSVTSPNSAAIWEQTTDSTYHPMELSFSDVAFHRPERRRNQWLVRIPFNFTVPTDFDHYFECKFRWKTFSGTLIRGLLNGGSRKSEWKQRVVETFDLLSAYRVSHRSKWTHTVYPTFRIGSEYHKSPVFRSHDVYNFVTGSDS